MPITPWVPPGIMSGGIPLPPPAAGAVNTPPGPQGPLWLQKFAGGFNKFANGLSGYAPSPYLSPEENQALQQRQRAATFAQLAASSGPTVAGTTGPLQAFGQATAAGLNAGQSGVEDAIKARLANAQMQHLQAGGSLIGSASPSDFTPSSLAKYKQTQNPADLVPIEKNMFGRFQPRDYTPESLNVFEQTHNPGDLRRIANYQFKDTPGGGIVGLDPISGAQVSTPLTPQEGTQQAADRAAAEARSKTLSEKQAGAEYDLPRQINNATQALDVIGSLKKHAGLPYITGWYSKAPIVPDTEQAGAEALAQQVEGKTFLEAYNSLRGGGSITETEGKKGTSAIARLYRSQSTEDYRSALNDLESVIKTGLERAKVQAGQKSGGDSLPSGVTEADITETMRANKMTRQQVLDKLNAR